MRVAEKLDWKGLILRYFTESLIDTQADTKHVITAWRHYTEWERFPVLCTVRRSRLLL
jgi:hypothetical protein